MLDIVQLQLQAGKGGDGSVSFHRAKYVPKGGPDGGDGGDGGSIFVVGTKHRNTLQQFAGKTAFKAESGENGSKQKKSGRKGQDLYLEVPLGTVIWKLNETMELSQSESDEWEEDIVIQRQKKLNQTRIDKLDKELVAEILEDGQQIEICKGGRGGRGNDHFKSASNQTPMQAEKGTLGEELEVLFELKLLADVGLVGFPNAGKSTFLSRITKANPKIGHYPFTTIEPNLGILHFSEINREMVIADIPGLVEGASKGKGLGLQFLRHIERCRGLMFVLYIEESIVFDDQMTIQQKVKSLLSQFEKLQTELREYKDELLELPYFVTVNKIDLYSSELQTAIKQAFADQQIEVWLWSGVTGNGEAEVKNQLQQFVL